MISGVGASVVVEEGGEKGEDGRFFVINLFVGFK